MSPLLRSLGALVLCLVPIGAPTQRLDGPPQLVWRPRVPLEGSVLVLGLEPGGADSVTAVRGELAGELLHFERVPAGFRALGAVPLGTARRVAARLTIERAGGASDTLVASLPVGRRRAPRERLRVAPEFVAPPDSFAERIRAEQQLVQQVRRSAHDAPRLWQERFVRPRAGAVTSVFGVARVFNGVPRGRHLGVDFAGSRGAPVVAANRGVVSLVADLYFSGTTVFIDHGAGLVTAYLHLSRVHVSPGDTVDRGQLIGEVGASGRVTRPHLHWLAAYGDITFDPLGLLGLDFDDRRHRR